MEMNRKAFRTLIGGVILCIVVYWLLHETERVKVVVKSIYGLFSPFVLGAALTRSMVCRLRMGLDTKDSSGLIEPPPGCVGQIGRGEDRCPEIG